MQPNQYCHLLLECRRHLWIFPRLFMNYSNFLPVGGRRVGRARGSRAFDVSQLFLSGRVILHKFWSRSHIYVRCILLPFVRQELRPSKLRRNEKAEIRLWARIWCSPGCLGPPLYLDCFVYRLMVCLISQRELPRSRGKEESEQLSQAIT